MFSNTKIKSAFSYFLICVVFFALILILNQKTVYTADDYMYHFFWENPFPSGTTRPLEGIEDLPVSLWNHYQAYNGRVISHAIVMFFMMFDKNVFNICNSLAFLFLGWLLLAFTENDYSKWKAWHLGVVYLLMLAFLPNFGLSVLWVSGACNYLWMTVIGLLYLFPYQYHMNNPEKRRHQLLKGILMIPVGFLAGGTNENGGGAVILLALLFVGYWFQRKEKIPCWSIAGIFSACMGMGVMLLSPSSRGRMVSEPFSVLTYLKRFRGIIGFSYHYILLLSLILMIVCYVLIKNKAQTKENWVLYIIIPFFYCISGMASIIVLLASPIISGKSWIWAVCFIIIAIGQIAGKIKVDPGFERWKRIAVVLLIVLAFGRYGTAYMDISRTYDEANEQIRMIQEQKSQGIREVTVYLLTPTENTYNAIRHNPNVSIDKEAWFNQWMAVYYDVDSITGAER